MRPPTDSTITFTEHKITPSSHTDQSNLSLLRPLAIVIPWFGRGQHGGAEMHAWQLATRLAQRGRLVEVITTCCRSYQDDWGINHLPAGTTREPEGFSVRRFPVEPRDREAFDRVNGKLLAISKHELKAGINPLTPNECNIFADELIKSSMLLDFIRAQAESYHAFLFLPYLYGTTLRGIPRVAEKAFLQPCLHHEAYAYLPQVFDTFFQARNVLYLSDGEAELAARIYGPGILPKSIVVGAGVDDPIAGEDAAILDQLAGRPFVLCLGRQDVGKNTDMLARAFAQFRETHPDSELCLIIAGPGHAPLPKNCPGLFNVGTASEAQKNVLLARCRMLVHPSKNESYSRVIMEAWRFGRPVAAHADCLATATAVTRANGGWLAGEEKEWAQLLLDVATTPEEQLSLIGAAGRRYSATMANWGQVIDAYERVLWKDIPAPQPLNRLPIHQVLPNFVYGDAISNHARTLRDILRSMGHSSEIYALDTAKDIAHETHPFKTDCLRKSDAVIYHHSIGTAVTQTIIAHPGPKCLIYHNITPHEFFTPYLPVHEFLCREGRAKLPELASHFSFSVGDSRFNADELKATGFRDPGVLPILVDPSKWSIRPDPEIIHQLSDGRTNLLFVGRIVPNKCQEDLIAAFACYHQIDPTARLFLVGGTVSPNDLYLECLQELASRLRVADSVVFTGSVTDEELCAYYRSADLFWSMSEHEGFCVPLVEAMWFNIPVLAYNCTAVGETLAGAGVLFESKDDLPSLARTASMLVNNKSRRASVLKTQQKRRTAFSEESIRPIISRLIQELSPTSYRPNSKEPPQKGIKRRVAFIVQRSGHEINGGAEQLCLQTAEMLAVHCEIDILTTCALDYMTWANHFPPGIQHITKNARIIRFPVDHPRNVTDFNQLSAELLPNIGVCRDEDFYRWIRSQGPSSEALLNYIESHSGTYDAFFFHGYLYAQCALGLPLVADKSVLVPYAHDEWPLKFPSWRRVFSLPAALLCSTIEEKQHLLTRFADAPEIKINEALIGGCGVVPPSITRPDVFREKFGIKGRKYLLYVGRIDESKGCGDLFSAYINARNSGVCTSLLVLIGKKVMPIPEHPDIIQCGFVEDQTKWDAIAGCTALILPSSYESLSLSVLESLALGRPVIVNGKSEVLVGHCVRSGAGISYTDQKDLTKIFANIETDPVSLEKLGLNGPEYIKNNYTWEKIIATYMSLVDLVGKKHHALSTSKTEFN